MTLHDNIRRIRKAAGLTAEKAAERAGMHRITWSDIERGKNANPTVATLTKIAGALDISLADLFVGGVAVRVSSHEARRYPRVIAEVRDDLGDELFTAMLQLQIAANRLTAALELQLVNGQSVEPQNESGASRNRIALFAWSLTELYEMTRAIDRMGRHEVDGHLTWAQDSMRALRELGRRWKAPRYRQLRNKMGAHIKPDTLNLGIERLQKKQAEIVAVWMSGPEARCLNFSGADEILIEGVFGPSPNDGLNRKGMRTLQQVRDDTVEARPLITDVVLDLFGVPREAAKDDS